ncbi:MAG: DegT/DnrJ/EryC1/StrS family aminotransferase [Flavobacteriaceae bacterium]|nr:DegT/DnrJ/EryC1/StrS family aminotransferase [Flavobacteriaceae bacterium]
MIPFYDIKAENKPYAAQFAKELTLCMEHGQFILGDAVKDFEMQYAAFCGTKHCVGVSNGLDALRLIFEGYKELGVLQEGDAVLVPAHTYIASILAVIQSGLKPVFVEPELSSFGMDILEAKQVTTSLVKACLIVHLYGSLVNVELFQKFAKNNKLLLIEDAAQAHGAIDASGQKAGAIGNAAAFSFYPTKNIGALGDAGAVTTNNTDLNNAIRSIQNYGAAKKHQHDTLGFNMRLDNLQARFLSVKLKDYPEAMKRRIQIAHGYSSSIKNPKITLPVHPNDDSHVFHLYVVRVGDRKGFVKYLNEEGIGNLIHYPIPPHKQKALSAFTNLTLPITEKYHETVVSIPLYPSLSDESIQRIIEVLNAY